MVGMSQLKEHYRLLLGLDDAWQVDSVDLQLEEQMVVIRLEHGAKGSYVLNVDVHAHRQISLPNEHASPGHNAVHDRATGSCSALQL